MKIQRVTFRKSVFGSLKETVWYLCIDGKQNKKIFIYDVKITEEDDMMIYGINFYNKYLPSISTPYITDYFKSLADAKQHLVEHLNRQ